MRTKDKKFIAPEFIGPSLTTYGTGNPSFREYIIDSDTNVILDFKQWRVDLDKYNAMAKAGNTQQKPQWYVAYTLKGEYGMKDTSFAEWMRIDQLRLNDDQTFMEKYHFNYKAGLERPLTSDDRKWYKCSTWTHYADV